MSEEAAVTCAGWEDRIDQLVIASKLALQTDDWTTVSNLFAAQQHDGIDHATIFRKTGQERQPDLSLNDARPELRIVLTRLTLGILDAYKKFSDKVGDLKRQPHDKRAWEKLIASAADGLKKNAMDLVDVAAADAKAIVSKLPPEGQEEAAKFFQRGLSGVVNYFKDEVWEMVKSVQMAVDMFLKGKWGKLSQAWEAVERAADAVIGWLQKLEG